MALSMAPKKKIDLTMGVTQQPVTPAQPLQVVQARPQQLGPVVSAYNPYNVAAQSPYRQPTLQVTGARPTIRPRNYVTEFAGGVGNTLVDIARTIPRFGASAASQVKGQNEYTARNAYEKFLWGDQPVKSFEQGGRDATNFAQAAAGSKYDPKTDKLSWTKGTAGDALPGIAAAGIGATVALSDFIPGGKGRKQVIDETAKAAAKGSKTTRVPVQAAPMGDAPATIPVQKGPPTKAMEDLMEQQDKQSKKYDVPTVKNAYNKFTEQVYDPYNLLQRLDNLSFKKDKELGLRNDGQSEMLGRNSLAKLMGRRLDPYQPAAVRDSVKYAADDGNQYSLDDIIKIYGDDDNINARKFNVYRVFMDELEMRKDFRGRPSIPYTNNQMVREVAEYLRENPSAPYHHQALRAKELQDVLEKEQADIVAPGTYDELSKRKYYTPRTEQTAENAIKMQVSGGMRGGIKGILSRKDRNIAATSPLSLYKTNSVNHERSLAEQLFGREMKYRLDRGDLSDMDYKEVVSAQTAIRHKQVRDQAQEVRKELLIAKRIRDKIAADRRSVSLKQESAGRAASSAKKSQESLKRTINTNLQKKLEAAENKVAASVRKLIAASKGDKEQVLNDLAELGPKNYKKAELLEIGAAIGRMVDEFEMTSTQRNALSKATGKRLVTRRRSNRLQGEVDDLRAMLEQARTDIADTEAAKKAVNAEVRETTQYRPFDTQAVKYMEQGEVGRIEVPGDFQRMMDSINRMNERSLVDKGLAGAANAQKLFWTGPFSPKFKLWEFLATNPTLMFVNGQGFSALGYNAAKSWVMPIFQRREWQTFKKEMQKRNVSYENVFQSRNIRKEVAADIARRADPEAYAKAFLTTKEGFKGGFKDAWKAFAHYAAVGANKQRYAAAYGAYKRAKRNNWPEDEALEWAADTPARIFGDFERVSKLAQTLEPLSPYTGATQAGFRATARSLKTRPVETAAKVATLAGGMVGLTAYSLSNANEYYEDMIEKGQEWRLDNNWVIALPWANKASAQDEIDSGGKVKEGEWFGIWNIPMVPDARPMNRAIWKTVYEQTKGLKTDPGRLAWELFNQVTADMSSNAYDPEKAEGGNPLTGVLPSSPGLNVIKTGMNVNTYNGRPLADDYTSSLPRTEQVNQTGTETSKGAIEMSKNTGGLFTPQQWDQILGQMGTVGTAAKDPEGGAGLDLLKPTKPGVSLSDKKKSGRDWSIDMKEASKGLDEKTFRVIQTLNAKGNKGLIDKAEEATLLTNNPKALKVMVDVAMKSKARGEKINPLYDRDVLDDNQRLVVLRIMGEKDANPGDKILTKKMEKDNPWIKDYYQKQSAFFDEIFKNSKTNDKGERIDKDGEVIVSGSKNAIGIDKPQQTDEITRKFKVAEQMTDPKTKAEFYKNNPDITEYLARNEEYNRMKRAALMLPQLDRFPENPQAKALEEAYFKLPTKDGKRGGNKSRSDFIKANPLLADYWLAKAKYQLNEAAAMARYEGEELDNDALKDAKTVGKLADGGTGSGFGSGSGYYGKKGRRGGRSSAVNERAYRISDKARPIAKPKVTAKGGKGKKPVKAKVSKPKVTSRKSLV